MAGSGTTHYRCRTSGEGKVVGSLACKKRFTTSIPFGNAMEVHCLSTLIPRPIVACRCRARRARRLSRVPRWDIADCGFGSIAGLLTLPCSHCWRSKSRYHVQRMLLWQATCKELLRPAVSFHMKATIEEIGIEGVFNDWQARGARGRAILRLKLVRRIPLVLPHC